MAEDVVSQELGRARKLLSPRRLGEELEETAPEQSPESVGALAGIGLRANKAPEVTASVYVFAEWGDGDRAAQQLREQIPTDGWYVAQSTNGRLLFFGATRTDKPDGLAAQFHLAKLVSAFAGRE
jgi:hypothetical protein